MGTIYISIYWRMDKHLFNGQLLSNKKEWTIGVCNSTDEAQKHCAKWRKPATDAGFSRVGRRLGVRLPSWAGRRLQRRPAASAVSDRAAPAPATGESRCRSTFLPAVGALKVIVGFSPTENSGKHPAQPWCPVKSMMWLL
ncbi:hypothetical protein HJG60_008817 [Phyllostomus discolor]|uniref:Uncharacterized protein n=1 Tax=Phyllostomus discolor TaxID=89673 RepID=A0A834DI63_9CHIR|nr:hypothetical protein HJG60_008817 [Phyllostomus discolor]